MKPPQSPMLFIDEFPNHGCLAVLPDTFGQGTDAVPRGWATMWYGRKVGPTHRARWEAQAWAAGQFHLDGWPERRDARRWNTAYAAPPEWTRAIRPLVTPADSEAFPFLDKIVGDDTTRLVLADWVEDRNAHRLAGWLRDPGEWVAVLTPGYPNAPVPAWHAKTKDNPGVVPLASADWTFNWPSADFLNSDRARTVVDILLDHQARLPAWAKAIRKRPVGPGSSPGGQ